VHLEGERGRRLRAHEHPAVFHKRQDSLQVEGGDLPSPVGIAAQHLRDPAGPLLRESDSDSVAPEDLLYHEREPRVVVVGEDVVEEGDAWSAR